MVDTLFPCVSTIKSPNSLLGPILGLGMGLLLAGPVHGQDDGTDAGADSARAAGRLVYFEGEVGVETGGEWRPAQIDQPLDPAARVGTGPDAKAEIQWPSGRQHTLGPADTQRVAQLRAQAEIPSNSASLFERFRELFTERTETADDPAAPRRGAGTPFEQAAVLYRDRQFEDALPLFQTALAADSTGQEAAAAPVDSSNVPLAHFALAHCYLETGQRAAAQKVLRSLVKKHPESELATMARSLLDQL